eukprot:gene4241-1284_t
MGLPSKIETDDWKCRIMDCVREGGHFTTANEVYGLLLECEDHFMCDNYSANVAAVERQSRPLGRTQQSRPLGRTQQGTLRTDCMFYEPNTTDICAHLDDVPNAVDKQAYKTKRAYHKALSIPSPPAHLWCQTAADVRKQIKAGVQPTQLKIDWRHPPLINEAILHGLRSLTKGVILRGAENTQHLDAFLPAVQERALQMGVRRWRAMPAKAKGGSLLGAMYGNKDAQGASFINMHFPTMSPEEKEKERQLAAERARAEAAKREAAKKAAQAKGEAKRKEDLRQAAGAVGVWQCSCGTFVGPVDYQRIYFPVRRLTMRGGGGFFTYIKGRGLSLELDTTPALPSTHTWVWLAALLIAASDSSHEVIFAVLASKKRNASFVCWRCGKTRPWRCAGCGFGLQNGQCVNYRGCSKSKMPVFENPQERYKGPWFADPNDERYETSGANSPGQQFNYSCIIQEHMIHREPPARAQTPASEPPARAHGPRLKADAPPARAHTPEPPARVHALGPLACGKAHCDGILYPRYAAKIIADLIIKVKIQIAEQVEKKQKERAERQAAKGEEGKLVYNRYSPPARDFALGML